MTSADSTQSSASSHREARATFFRQGGWMMIATVAGGAMMAGIHFLSRAVGDKEYKIFLAMLAVAMQVPTIPLQMVFAQQTAAALAADRKRQLTRMIRAAWIGSFVLWLILAVGMFCYRDKIVTGWGVSNRAALWVTLGVVLLSLWSPMFLGIMQGQQNFKWLGWCQIAGAFGRIVPACVIVLLLGGRATGMAMGVLIGLAGATLIGIWQTRALWLGESEWFDWKAFLRQVIPLMLGFGAAQFFFTGDTMFVTRFFDAEQAAPYGAAGTLSRALLWLVLPLAAVMFPKIVHSSVKAQKTDLQLVVLVGTGILGVCAIAGLWIFGPIALKIMYPGDWTQKAAALLPWYGGAMVPLALANVLVNDLLARSRFGIVPVLVLLAAGYGYALSRFHDTLLMVLQTLGAFNVLTLIACVIFTWVIKPRPAAQSSSSAS